MSISTDELRSQWANPSDILSLLLLIGSDIVQKAIAQLVGHRIHLYGDKRNRGFSIAPVAFSFGWAAYGFSNLLSAIGDMRLMPTSDCPSFLVTCSNGFVRENQSWVLGRLLRDHEIKYPVDPRPEDEGGRAESIRIDVFNLLPVSRPTCDFVWWLGWVVLLAQVGIAIVPWVLYDDWGIFAITLCGNLFVAATCALPQWTQEKWAGRRLKRDKVTCLTRGNGHFHIMVFIGTRGSWDLESLASSVPVPRPETRWLSLLLAILWTCLLISISGFKEHTWFLVGIGSIGMLQNVFAAGTPREPGASDFHITRFSRVSTIIGRRKDYRDDMDCKVDMEEALEELADIASWASEKPPLVLQSDNSLPNEAAPMPRWLVTMSKSDGVPSWLEPLKPVSLTNHTPSICRLIPRIWRQHVTDIDKQDEVVYAIGVHGALIELEKWVPTAGLAMAQTFFPAGLQYNDAAIRDNKHKKFWQRAYHTKSIRDRAAVKRRAEEVAPTPMGF
ncbi:hypothetical protein GL218_04504 [Daldinia childiae]|uniref:uncharacterized protein n=1 Tax=Daldinia childiae TaxID=326645 RepID=UPI0014463BF2|nr:uncharacterized protein GL218_04504 [Daldinia childiae]KAF3059525.1 hypothetical protein GL218_04504 [Daldinia childiae]